MASIQQSSGGRRRSLDAELNLVPFIDLLSMCICFLLMTAVWMEVSSLQIKQILGTDAAAPAPNAIDLRIDLVADKSLQVSVERQGKVLQALTLPQVSGTQNLSSLGNLLQALVRELSAGGQQPDVTARIVPNDQVPYRELVSVLDLLRSYGITQLGIVPVAGHAKGAK